MARFLRGLLAFAFGVVVAWFWLVPESRAESIPATLNPAVPVAYYQAPGDAFPGQAGGTYYDAQQRAKAYYASSGVTGWFYGPTQFSLTPPPDPWSAGGAQGTEGFTLRLDANTMGNGGSGWTYSLSKSYRCVAGSQVGNYPNWTCSGGAGTYSCPANQNWTLQGNQCVRPDCTANQVRQADGTCWSCPADRYLAETVGGGMYLTAGPAHSELSGPEVGGSKPATTCVWGCVVDIDGPNQSQGWGGPDGRWWSSGEHKLTGAACAAGVAGQSDGVQPERQTPEAKCIAGGMSYGTVNGTVLCVASGDTRRTATKETTGPAGGKTKTTETEVCTGGSCNSTTTTTHVGGGASGGQLDGTTTSTTTAAAGGGGQTGEGKSACEEDPYGAACLGSPAEGGGAESASGGGVSAITPYGLASASGCPADVAIGHGVSVPFLHACSFASMVAPLVLAFAWLGAGMFVLGGLRNG